MAHEMAAGIVAAIEQKFHYSIYNFDINLGKQSWSIFRWRNSRPG